MENIYKPGSINPILLRLTLNVNGLNSQIKRDNQDRL